MPEEQTGGKKKKILLIEDDLFYRKLFRDQLTRAGFEFVDAANGIEGEDKILTENPDIILLDLMLPRKNGFDVLSEIRKNPKTKDIPVIILSILGQQSDIDEAMSRGANGYLVKSDIRTSEVIEKINGMVS